MKRNWKSSIIAACVAAALWTTPAAAQALTISLTTGTFSWGWTAAATGETATSFRMHCGSATKTYSLMKDSGTVAVKTMLISAIITTPGTYFCAVTSYASSTGLESGPSNEVTFSAATPPTGPTTLTVQ